MNLNSTTMIRIMAKSTMILSAIAMIFAFTFLNDDGKVHIKVTRVVNDEKSVFEKLYESMEALKADDTLKQFDLMVADWISENGEKTELTDEKIDELIRNHKEPGDEIHVKKKIKVIAEGKDDEKEVFIMKSDGDRDMVWIYEHGNETKLTDEKIAKLKEKHEGAGSIQKKVEVIVSDEESAKKNVVMIKGDGKEVAEIELEVETETDEDGNTVIKDKKVWITKDGEKIEPGDEKSFQLNTEGKNVKIIFDSKILDLADFSGGEFDGERDVFIVKKGESKGSVKQTMNVNVEEKNGETFIEIDIKRNAVQNVTISEIEKSDAGFEDIPFSLKNNLKPSQLNYYPNPSGGKFTLDFNLKGKGEITVKVTDLLGKNVYKETILDFAGSYKNQIDLTNQEKGVYVLQVIQGRKMLTRKILIE